MKILIDSVSPRFGDTLLGLPFTSMFKYRYDTEITYACGPNDFEFFKNISTIDRVCLQSIFNQANRAYDKSFDRILRTSFDVDEKFHPEQIFGDLDTPEGWDQCREKFPILLKTDRVLDIRQAPEDVSHPLKKKIGLFINFPRPNSTMPQGTESYSIEKWQQVIDLGSEYNFFVFTSPIEKDFELKNCNNLGKLDARYEMDVMKQMDVVVGCSSGVMDMVACFAQKPLVILETCEDDRTPCWNGIPDKCVLPQNRYAYFIMENEDVRSFIKPPDGARCVQWNFNNYFLGQTQIRNMRVLDAIEPQTIVDEVDRILKEGYGAEWFVKGSVCDNCIPKKNGQCAYQHKPQLKNGKYYEGCFEG